MAKTSTIDPRSPVLQKALEKGESVRWSSQPRVRLFGFQDLIIIPFMSVWCFGVFAIFGSLWMRFLTKHDASGAFMLFFSSFMASVGFYMLAGRIIHNYLLCKGRYYVVTNKRVLVYSSFWPAKIDSMPLDKVENVWIWRDAKAANQGMIAFGEPQANDQQLASLGAPPPLNGSNNRTVFYDLEDIQSPLAAIQSACAGRELKVEEVRSLLSNLKWSVDKSNAPQGSGNKLTFSATFGNATPIQISRPTNPTPEILTNSEKERLVEQRRRLYIYRSVGLLFGAAAAFCFGTSQLAMYERDFKAATQCKNWPSVQGKIAHISVIRSKGAPRLHGFRVDFMVANNTYHCDRFSFRMGNAQERKAELAFGTQNKVGDPAEVFYDPKDPDTSVLDRSSDMAAIAGRKASGVGGQIVAALFLAAAAFRIMFGSRQNFAPKPLKNDSLGGQLYASAFLSIWFAMLFCFLLAPLIGGLVTSATK